MKDELKRLARVNGERSRALASRVAFLCKLYGRDPSRNQYLRQEIEILARRVVRHMRQAVIIGAMIAKIEGKHRGHDRSCAQKRRKS